MSIQYKKYAKGLVALGLLTLVSTSQAQPAGNTIITGATAIEYAGCKKVEVEFSIPFRYLSHYPNHEGKVLRIQLLPLSQNEEFTSSLSDQESVRVLNRDVETWIEEIIYEKAYSSQRPFLDIRFERNVYFNVKSGENFRSVIVLISDSDNLKCLNDSE